MNRIVIALALVIVGTGCAGRMEHVVRHERGGIVRIGGALVESTSAAHLAMTEHCGGRWRALEGEAAIAMMLASSAAKSTVAPTVAIDDSHIAYECISRR